ncbi:Tip elongation aberrant protein 1 (Altered polarity protein 8) (Cell polarity protein tea1), partial [Durusdinium trenchii]
SAPTARWGHTMEGYDTELVIFGGIAEESALLSDEGARGPVRPPFAAGRFTHGGSTTNSLHKLQTQSLKWEVVSCGGTPPSARCFHGACVANDLYVVFGGNEATDFSQPLNDLHLLDLRSGTWTSPETNGEAPSPRFGHKLIHGPDNQIFVFGGSTSAGAVPGSLHSFKLSTNTWCTVQ